MEQKNDRVLYGVLCILLNCYGVPQFMRGKKNEGIKHVLITLFTFGIGLLIYQIIGLIEGIRILGLSDEAYLKEKYGA